MKFLSLRRCAFTFLSLLEVVSSHSISQSSLKEKTWKIGGDFELHGKGETFQIYQAGSPILSTIPGRPFVSASGGNDSFVESNGAFNITQVDTLTCQELNVTAVKHVSHSKAIAGSAVEVTGHLLDCGNATAPYTLSLWVSSSLPDRVAFSLSVSSSILTKVFLTFASTASEDVYGLGAQASFASLKNQSIPVFTREQGQGRGDQPITSLENAAGGFTGGSRYTTYTSIPSYITTSGRLFYLAEESTAYALFDFTAANAITIRYEFLSVTGAFAQGKDMFEAVEKLTAYTGRMPALPAWVDTGAVLGIQGGQTKVNGIVQQGLNLSCPIAAVWLQDWVGTHAQAAPYVNVSRLWWNWENDEVLYPEWSSFVQTLRDKYSVRTLSYINPFLANVSTKPDGYRRNLYAEADALHYLVQNSTINGTSVISSGPGLTAGILDLTNSGLRSWFTEVLKKQVWSANISGFMTDFGEYTPVSADTRLANISHDALLYHNQYPFDWAQYHREVVEDLGLQNEAILFHRSASMGSNRYMNLFWAGDQNVNWQLNDGIKSAVTIMAQMGLSGYSQLHSDVGGYTTILSSYGNITRSPELLGRWGELAAVSSAVFRSHEGSIPSANAQFYSNVSTYLYYAYNTRMFVSLAAYRRKVLETESATKGWPLLRAPVMYHPNDFTARNISYQSFYLGASLYVAPVLDPNTAELEVYLPGTANGQTFTHVWSNVKYQGGTTVKVAAPYGKPAVFTVNDAATRVPELANFLKFVTKENTTVLTVT